MQCALKRISSVIRLRANRSIVFCGWMWFLPITITKSLSKSVHIWGRKKKTTKLISSPFIQYFSTLWYWRERESHKIFYLLKENSLIYSLKEYSPKLIWWNDSVAQTHFTFQAKGFSLCLNINLFLHSELHCSEIKAVDFPLLIRKHLQRENCFAWVAVVLCWFWRNLGFLGLRRLS